uniref:Uncharacterized protein n=1 Tax=Cyanoderma ruficeps TaxID=181631 RepID=A0A8C3NY02_9PASS
MDTPGTQLKDGYRCVLSRRHVLPVAVLTLLALTSPLLWGLALQLHSAVTGSYIPGTHSIALVTCLNEQIARDIARYFWKGELEESTEILAGQGAEPPAGLTPLLRASFRFRSIHPFEIPDIVSLPIHQGNPLYLQRSAAGFLGDSGTLLSGAGGSFYLLGFAAAQGFGIGKSPLPRER